MTRIRRPTQPTRKEAHEEAERRFEPATDTKANSGSHNSYSQNAGARLVEESPVPGADQGSTGMCAPDSKAAQNQNPGAQPVNDNKRNAEDA